MCIRNGSHWFINKQFFIAKFNHDDFLRRIQSDIDYGKKTNNMSHICIKHYYTNYSSPELPPLWMIFEALSFGTISKLFANLNRQYQKLISDQLNMPSEILKSWLWSTSYIRNLCAHHSRLWNRIFTIKPLIPKDKKLYPSEFTRNDTFYAQAIILQIFMKNIASESLWGTKLIALINNSEFQKIDKIKMGINKNTFSSDLWKN
jgi:abortive infection bacteriophage resistance protein